MYVYISEIKMEKRWLFRSMADWFAETDLQESKKVIKDLSSRFKITIKRTPYFLGLGVR